MDAVALGARVFLALVFAIAAAGKFVNLDRTRLTLRDFKVPPKLLPLAALLLPLAELSVAVVLLLGPVARVGASAAVVLLLVFMLGVGAAMSRGEAPACNCFGQIGSAPAGRGTLIRNAVLAAIAVLVVVHGPGNNPGSWLSARTHSEILAVVLGLSAVVLAAAMVDLWSERRTLRMDLARANLSLAAFPPGLPVGAAAPAFVLPTTTGESGSLDDLRERGRPVALVFASPSCRSCRYMLSDIARWQQTLPDRLTIAVVANASADEARAMAEEFGLSDVMYQGGQAEVFRAYRGSATPSVVIVTPDGRIATRIRSSQGVVENTIRSAVQTVVTSETANGDAANGAGDLDSSQLIVSRWSGTDGQRA